jgi:hypothetical protein
VRTFEGYVPKPQAAPVRAEGPAPQGNLFQIAKRKHKPEEVLDGVE